MSIQKIEPHIFKILAGMSIHPNARVMYEELEHYMSEDKRLLGVVAFDITDHDYSVAILGRDEVGSFRCIDMKTSITKIDDARQWLINSFKWYLSQKCAFFPQGVNTKVLQLFSPIVELKKMHPGFARLNNDIGFSAAKSLIEHIMPYFADMDGNFIEQFQSTGFDSRIWELCLFAYFKEENLLVRRENNRPDFILESYGEQVAIEAVIANRKDNSVPSYFKTEVQYPSSDEIKEINLNEMPIRFGSPLYSKLNKKYWELEHVKGKPLIFAIADFHDDQSMIWSHSALPILLYGYMHEYSHEKDGKLKVVPVKVNEHVLGDKRIPSSFFAYPDAENISAVLFSPCGTLSKFNRIGKQAGLGDSSVVLIAEGDIYQHDPNASQPKRVVYNVNQGSKETWANGFVMYHNPKAIYPVNPELFPSIAHFWCDEDGLLSGSIPEFHPYFIMTLIIKTE